VCYRTAILGCEITLEAPAAPESIAVAEAVLGTIEAFFATSLNERIVPFRPIGKIIVEPACDLHQGLCITDENIDGHAFVRVQHPSTTPGSTADARLEFRDGLMSLLTTFMLHIAVVENVDCYMSRIAGEERGFSRALLFSEVSLAQGNVFGPSPKVLLRDCEPPSGSKRFPLIRSSEWNTGLSITQLPLPDGNDEQRDPRNAYAYSASQAANEKHSDRKIASQIDIPLGDRAGWRAPYFTTLTRE